MGRLPLQNFDVDTALRTILQGTAGETGADFFKAMVVNLARALDIHGAWVTEYLPDKRSLKPFAFWLGQGWIDMMEMPVDGTPCEQVVEERSLVHIRENLLAIYPDASSAKATGVASYMGVPLLELDDPKNVS